MNKNYNMFLHKETHENLCYRLVKSFNKRHQYKFNLRIVYNTYTFILSIILLIILSAFLLNIYYRVVVPILIWHHNQIEYKIFIEQSLESKEKQKQLEKEKHIEQLEKELLEKEHILKSKIENINKILQEK